MAHVAHITDYRPMAKPTAPTALDGAIAAHRELSRERGKVSRQFDRLFHEQPDLFCEVRVVIGKRADGDVPRFAYDREAIRKDAKTWMDASLAMQRPNVADGYRRMFDRKLREFDNAVRRKKRARDRTGYTRLTAERERLERETARALILVMLTPTAPGEALIKRQYVRRHLPDISFAWPTMLRDLLFEITVPEAA